MSKRFVKRLSRQLFSTKVGTTIGFLFFCACSRSIAGGLDEAEANRILVSLYGANIDADKESDSDATGKFQVRVSRNRETDALVALQREGLPREKTRAAVDQLTHGSLVLGQALEQAQLMAAVSIELERTLESIDGVFSARVHISVPERDVLRGPPTTAPTASVLVEHREPSPPIPDFDVARLVAGGVNGLAANDVSVVMRMRPPSITSATKFGSIGPFTVAESSVRPLTLLLAVLIGLLGLLASVILASYGRALRAAINRRNARTDNSTCIEYDAFNRR